jgi:hypothetical protein
MRSTSSIASIYFPSRLRGFRGRTRVSHMANKKLKSLLTSARSTPSKKKTNLKTTSTEENKKAKAPSTSFATN